MSRFTLPGLFCTLLVFATPVPAQTGGDLAPNTTESNPKSPEKSEDSIRQDGFWQATLSGGQYLIALNKISSVSRHKYLLDGALIVDEVTVDSIGQALARFYFITPVSDAIGGNVADKLANRGQQIIDKVAQRADTDLQDMVVKKYPETTHAKCIEYRLQSAAALSSLQASVSNAWVTGKGRSFSTEKTK